MTLNVALKTAIFSSGHSQREIALRARIPEARLSAIIRGRAAANPREQKRLAAVLGVPIAHLFTEPVPDPHEASA